MAVDLSPANSVATARGDRRLLLRSVQDMPRGTVKWFNDAKGYGFICCADGREVFVHYSAISGDGFRTLSQGQSLEYEEQQGPRGVHAVKVSTVASATEETEDTADRR